MKPSNPQVAGYGLYYRANNQLIPKMADRVLLQCLVDMVRPQLKQSLNNQTIFISNKQLGRICGIDSGKTIPSSLGRLESLGLIKRLTDAITINCDFYVTLIQHYETLGMRERGEFAYAFINNGAKVLELSNIQIREMSRTELLGMTGTSISIANGKNAGNFQSDWKLPTFSETNGKDVGNFQHYVGNFQHYDWKLPAFLETNSENVGNFQSSWKLPAFLETSGENAGNFQHYAGNFQHYAGNFQHYDWKLPTFSETNSENAGNFQSDWKLPTGMETSNLIGFLQHLMQQMAKTLEVSNTYWKFPALLEAVNVGNLQSDVVSALKIAFETGKLPNSVIFDPQKALEVSNFMIGSFQLFAQKALETSNTDIIYNNKENNEGELPLKKRSEMEDETSQNEQKNIFEDWGQVSIVDLEKSSEENLKSYEAIEDFNMEASRKRASRILKDRNPYKDKPFLKVKKVEEIMEGLEEVIKSPVDFFIYNFVWGLYDLHCDHYQPSLKYDEQGDEMEEPQDCDWKEIVGTLLPQDEVCSLAMNIYDDLRGALERGCYEMVDESGNAWRHTFSFDDLENFNPVQIFQWEPYKMQDKVTPAFKVAIDKFYDIEANDVLHVSRTIAKEDKQRRAAQDKALVELIRSAGNSQLTPMETAIKKFYDDFVVVNDEGYIEQFLDGKGEPMEGNGRLPDFKIKPWCVGRRVKYEDFVSVFAVNYKPCDGLPKRAYIFSAERVVRWNELNGHRDSIAHQALQA